MVFNEIIKLATDDATRISVLLRKCLVLGHLLKNDRLKAWAQHELNGYKDEEVPSYRTVAADAKGNFAGPFNSSWNSWPIPSLILEEAHRKWGEQALLTQAIAAYEDVLQQPGTGQIALAWPSDLALYYQSRIAQDKRMLLVSAWQEIPKSAIVELLDTVRNRVLSLALELKDEFGEDDEALNELSAQTADVVDKKVVQQIYGSTIYVASGDASIQVQNTTLVPGNWDQLEKALIAAGLAKGKVNELSEAVKADDSAMGNKVLSWIKQQAPNVLTGGVKIGASVGQAVLTEYLKQHFGVHS